MRQFGFWLDDAGKDMNKIVGVVFEKLKAELGTLRTNINKITGEELDKYQAYSETANPDAPAEDKPYTDEQEYVIYYKELFDFNSIWNSSWTVEMVC